jgi:predicted phosphoribosyltransferase
MFADRVDAGRQLADTLAESGVWDNAMVLGIPRGGVVVAAEVAEHLGVPLDVVAAAKVGAPGNPEYAVGAVTADGEVLVNTGSGFSAAEVRALAAPALTKVKRSLELFRGGGHAREVERHQVILVDDGLATGLTAHAAVEYLRRCGATMIVLAVPVASAGAVSNLEPLVDSMVVVETPDEFSAVSQFYRSFDQTTDEEVSQLLKSHGFGLSD